jgi:hypothetical protein
MKKTVTVILFGTLPLLARANVVWPALYTETKINACPIILLSLVLEYLAIRFLFRRATGISALYTVAGNLVSGIAGMVLRPLSGILWELSLGQAVMALFDWGTFNPVAWFCVPLIGGAINSILELGTLRIVWKEKMTWKRFAWFWFMNWITVGLATVWVIVCPPNL